MNIVDHVRITVDAGHDGVKCTYTWLGTVSGIRCISMQAQVCVGVSVFCRIHKRGRKIVMPDHLWNLVLCQFSEYFSMMRFAFPPKSYVLGIR